LFRVIVARVGNLCLEDVEQPRSHRLQRQGSVHCPRLVVPLLLIHVLVNLALSLLPLPSSLSLPFGLFLFPPSPFFFRFIHVQARFFVAVLVGEQLGRTLGFDARFRHQLGCLGAVFTCAGLGLPSVPFPLPTTTHRATHERLKTLEGLVHLLCECLAGVLVQPRAVCDRIGGGSDWPSGTHRLDPTELANHQTRTACSGYTVKISCTWIRNDLWGSPASNSAAVTHTAKTTVTKKAWESTISYHTTVQPIQTTAAKTKDHWQD
jgi:hypothetical protein